MNRWQFRGVVRPDGHFAYRQEIARLLRASVGKYIHVEIRALEKRRSLKQNAYYWSAVVPQIREELFAANGDTVSEQDVHEYLKQEVGGLTKRIWLADGSSKEISSSTSKLTTKEWEDYMEKVRAFAARYGVIINLPAKEEEDEYRD